MGREKEKGSTYKEEGEERRRKEKKVMFRGSF